MFDKQSPKEIIVSVASMMKGMNFAFLRISNKYGSPLVSPLWIDVDGDNNTVI
jgi:hypothetical protein